MADPRQRAVIAMVGNEPKVETSRWPSRQAKKVLMQNQERRQSCILLVCGPGRTQGAAHACYPLLQFQRAFAEFALRLLLEVAFANACNRDFQLLEGITKRFAKEFAFRRMDQGMRCENPGKIRQWAA